MQVLAVGSPYARRCWICARTPVRASGKIAGAGLVSVAPMPAKLFADARTTPVKRNHPVSTMLCTKATSPPTRSAAPSSMKYCASVATGTVAAKLPVPGCRALNHATNCSGVSLAAPMIDTVAAWGEVEVGAVGADDAQVAANTAALMARAVRATTSRVESVAFMRPYCEPRHCMSTCSRHGGVSVRTSLG